MSTKANPVDPIEAAFAVLAEHLESFPAKLEKIAAEASRFGSEHGMALGAHVAEARDALHDAAYHWPPGLQRDYVDLEAAARAEAKSAFLANHPAPPACRASLSAKIVLPGALRDLAAVKRALEDIVRHIAADRAALDSYAQCTGVEELAKQAQAAREAQELEERKHQAERTSSENALRAKMLKAGFLKATTDAPEAKPAKAAAR